MIFTEKKASDLFVKSDQKGRKRGIFTLIALVVSFMYMSLHYSISQIERNADRSIPISLIQ